MFYLDWLTKELPDRIVKFRPLQLILDWFSVRKRIHEATQLQTLVSPRSGPGETMHRAFSRRFECLSQLSTIGLLNLSLSRS
jgi:hypothetical protein